MNHYLIAALLAHASSSPAEGVQSSTPRPAPSFEIRTADDAGQATEIYAVGDLTEALGRRHYDAGVRATTSGEPRTRQDFPPTHEAPGAVEDASLPSDPAELSRRGAPALEDLLRELARPPLRPDQDFLSVGNGLTLVVRCLPETQTWIVAFLDDMRRLLAAGTMVEVEVCFVTAPQGFFGGTAEQEYARTFATAAEFDSFRNRIQTDPGNQVLFAPRISVYPGMRTNISVAHRVAYVADWELVRVEPSGIEIADPLIAVVQEGTFLEVLPAPVPGLGGVQAGAWSVDCTARLTDVQRPIPTRTMQLGGGECEIALPEITESCVDTRLVLAPGTGAVFVMPGHRPNLDLAIVVRLQVVEPGSRLLGAGH